MSKFFDRDFAENHSLIDPAERVFQIHPREGGLLDYGEDTGSPSNPSSVDSVRALLCSAAMTVTLVDMTGVKRTAVPLQAGYNPIGVSEIHSVSAGTIWGLT